MIQGFKADVPQSLTGIGGGPSPVRLIHHGQPTVQALRREEPAFRAVSTAPTGFGAEAILEQGLASLLADARSRLHDQTSEIAGLLKNTSPAARAAPSLMSADGVRSYFTHIRIGAEARQTGGLFGGFDVFRIEYGTPTVDTLDMNTQLAITFAPIELGSDTADQNELQYPGNDHRNININLNDGVIAIEAAAMRYFLREAGPAVVPPGRSRTMILQLSEPTSAGPARVRSQPLVDSVAVKIAVRRAFVDLRTDTSGLDAVCAIRQSSSLNPTRCASSLDLLVAKRGVDRHLGQKTSHGNRENP